MPYFTIDTEVDISVDEFLYECDSNDIENLIEELIKKGYLTHKQIFQHKASQTSLFEQEHIKICNLLSDKFYQMDSADIQTLETLYKKYC
jgi:hypothetical protein